MAPSKRATLLAASKDLTPSDQTTPETDKLTSDALWTLVKFTIVMATLPMLSYYLVKRTFNDNIILGALAALVTVQITIAAYIYVAVKDSKSDPLKETHPTQMPQKVKKAQ